VKPETAIAHTGLRCTAPRVRLYAALRACGRAVTVSEACELVSDLGTATVYRNLELFERVGLVRRVGDGYAALTPGHTHALVCERCGCLVEFTECGVQGLIRGIERANDFVVTGHRLELTGLCGACRPRGKA